MTKPFWKCVIKHFFSLLNICSCLFICRMIPDHCTPSCQTYLDTCIYIYIYRRTDTNNVFLARQEENSLVNSRVRSRASPRFPAAASIVISIWFWLRGGSRRLLARMEASSRLLYRDHMVRKQGLKDTTPRTRFDEFPMIWASVYSFLLWNRCLTAPQHPQAPPAPPGPLSTPRPPQAPPGSWIPQARTCTSGYLSNKKHSVFTRQENWDAL